MTAASPDAGAAAELAGPRELLERYRPLLRYDVQEEYYAQPNFSSPGDYGRPFPDPTDEADGEGRSVRPVVTGITADEPGWVRLSGALGRDRGGLGPGRVFEPGRAALSGVTRLECAFVL